MNNWIEDEINADYLLNSGLLFEINRTYLHPVGIALTVKNHQLQFKDSREYPENLFFDKETMIKGYEKARMFWSEYGTKQNSIREKKLGSGVQPWVSNGKT